MKVTVAEELLHGVELSPREALIDFAVGIYSEGKVTLGRAARIAELSVSEFQRLLGERRIPLHYDIHDLEQDLTVVRERADDRSQ